jgi:hypothetical protein
LDGYDLHREVERTEDMLYSYDRVSQWAGEDRGDFFRVLSVNKGK